MGELFFSTIIETSKFSDSRAFHHSPFTKTQDKGHLNEIQEFGESIKTGSGYPIPLWQLVQATKISFEVEKQVSSSK